MAIKCLKCHTNNPSDFEFCKDCSTPLIPKEEIPVHTKTLQTPTKGAIKDAKEMLSMKSTNSLRS